MNFYQMLTQAVLSYEGIAFRYMAPSVFEDMQFEYVQNHLRILSAFYGVQKFDRLGYSFRPDLSSATEYVFERKIEQ